MASRIADRLSSAAKSEPDRFASDAWSEPALDGEEIARVWRHADRFLAQLVTQVSRWDRLKDPIGVMKGFERYAETLGRDRSDVHLVLAGPQCAAVSDDPEGLEVFEEVVDAWGSLHHDVRRRVHLASIPMDDMEENVAGAFEAGKH